MSRPGTAPSNARLIGSVVVRYLLWFITTAIFIVCILVARNTLLLLVASSGANQRVLNLISQVGIILMGLSIVVLIFIVEGRYKKAAEKGYKRLFTSFGFVSAWQVGFLVITWLLVWLVI